MNYHINLKEIEKTASKISQGLQGGDILALIGPLGSGKTTFTKALAKNLNIKQTIPSPTFTILQHFKGAHPVNRKVLHLYHLDLYRTKDYKEVQALGIEEFWTLPDSITVIEWADKIKNKLPKNTIYVNFES